MLICKRKLPIPFPSIFGLGGVFVAYKVASMLPMNVLTGIIICVMIYTAITFFRDAKKAEK